MQPSMNKDLLYIQGLESVNEKLSELLKMFHHNFPSLIVHLFRYSIFDQRMDGIFTYEQETIKAIPHWHDEIRTIPFLYDAVQKKEVVYLEGEYLQLRVSSKYTINEPVENILLVPIVVNNVVIAFISAINIHFSYNEEMKRYLEGFSEQMKHLLHLKPTTDMKNTFALSEKEIRVMQYIVNGYMTNEIAHFLSIAEPTVKYFIKNVMQKTVSRNRSEAIAKLFREQLLY